MEYKNQTENRAFQEMLQAAVKRLQNRSGEDLAAKIIGSIFFPLIMNQKTFQSGFDKFVNGCLKLVYLVRRSCLLVFSDIMASIECMLYNVSFLNSFSDVLSNHTNLTD